MSGERLEEMGGEELLERGENAVFDELRQIYCCKGAEFCRPTLQKAWLEIARLARRLREWERGRALLQWLTERTEEGLGAMEFCMTEDGNLGVFRNDNERPWGIGDDAETALRYAAENFPEGRPQREKQSIQPEIHCALCAKFDIDCRYCCLTRIEAGERPSGEEKQAGESVGPKGSEAERLLHIDVLEKEGCSCDAMAGFSCGIHELARMAREMQR